MSPAILERLGISCVSGTQQSRVHAALLALSRRVRDTRRQVLGLYPVEERSAVTPVMIQLALSLGELGAGPIAVIDANLQDPAFEPLAGDEPANAMDGFVTLELRPGPASERVSLAVPVPCAGPLPRARLARRVALERTRSRQVLLDLTGFDALGEQLFGFDLVDGVLSVAEVGATTERRMSSSQERVPAERSLGVLLVG